MIRSILLGAVAGARSMTPLAAVALAARRGRLGGGGRLPALLGGKAAVAGSVLFAIGELAGDKMKSAPDRIIAPGIAARLFTGAIAGAAVAPKRERVLAGALGAAAAVAASYVTFNARMRALRRYGQTKSGLVEDALVVASAVPLARAA